MCSLLIFFFNTQGEIPYLLKTMMYKYTLCSSEPKLPGADPGVVRVVRMNPLNWRERRFNSCGFWWKTKQDAVKFLVYKHFLFICKGLFGKTRDYSRSCQILNVPRWSHFWGCVVFVKNIAKTNVQWNLDFFGLKVLNSPKSSLKTLEIMFSRTLILKFPGGACPRTP